MYKVGQEEIDAVAAVVNSGKMFRYYEGGQCHTFEQRWAEYLGVKYAHMSSSGTTALTAALVGLAIGPGDEVVVPAHTYMATAVAVLVAGAIPIIVDVDESITLDPVALEQAIGPRTRAVIPVHMWGLPCDMDRIMAIATRHKLLVIEDACQAVGGGYKGKMLGAIGHAGAFSFNSFKNLTCGEGGAVVTNDLAVSRGARCSIDPCGFFWDASDGVKEFVANGSRASEIEGAIMNAQLDRLPGILADLRQQKQRILTRTGEAGLKSIVHHDPAGDCGSRLGFMFPTPEQASAFSQELNGMVAAHTKRHTFNHWSAILAGSAAHHPAMNPYNLPENRECRREYPADLCTRSLEILNRTALIGTVFGRSEADTDTAIDTMLATAERVGAIRMAKTA
jgi:dTDP-4-amino-4,6-dideoxygalactose transaminase